MIGKGVIRFKEIICIFSPNNSGLISVSHAEPKPKSVKWISLNGSCSPVFKLHSFSYFQEVIHKRIFCNFYGCGQKRSGGTEFLSQDDAQADGLAMDSNLADGEQSFNKNYLLENLERVPQALESLAAQNRDLMTSPEGEKYLRAAALWESLKHKLSIPSHRIRKRNT